MLANKALGLRRSIEHNDALPTDVNAGILREPL